MPVDLKSIRNKPARVAEILNGGKHSKGHRVEFLDYPRLSYVWQTHFGAAREKAGVADTVTWYVDGKGMPSFDAAIYYMESTPEPEPKLALEPQA